MVSVNSGDTLELGDGDTLEIGDYDIYYNSQEDRWEVKNSASKRSDGDIHGADFLPGRVGEHALTFDGLNDYVATNVNLDNYFSTGFSISAWIKPDSTSDGMIVGSNNSSDNQLNFRLVGGKAGISTFDGSNFAAARTTNISTGTWYHVVGTYDPSTGFKIYLDGVEEGSDSSTLTFKNNSHEAIGKRGNHTTEPKWFDGDIDDVRIYNRALSSSEVTELYNYGNDGSSMPPTDGLVAHYDFEQPEDPNTAVDTSTITHVPKNNSGSLFPTDLGDVLQGKALADDGNIYDSVQTAVDNSTGFVFVGPGTFTENVTISKEGLTLEGSGYDTLIDGGSRDDAILIQSDCTISNLSVKTNARTVGDNSTIADSGSHTSIIDNVTIRESDKHGIELSQGSDHIVTSCTIESTNSKGFLIGAPRTIVSSCSIQSGVSERGIESFTDDCIFVNNIIESVGAHGIYLDRINDTLVGGNRINDAGSSGVRLFNTNDTIVFNNRISGPNPPVDDDGGGTVLDGNLPEQSN